MWEDSVGYLVSIAYIMILMKMIPSFFTPIKLLLIKVPAYQWEYINCPPVVKFFLSPMIINLK